VLCAVAGCGAQGAGGPTEEGLSVDDSVAGQITGTYVRGADTLSFEAREIEPGLIDGWVELNGLTLTVLSHPAQAVASYDGWLADGRDAALTDSGRTILRAFSQDLGSYVTADFTPADVLMRAANVWGDLSDHTLTMEIVSDAAHGYTSLCSYIYTYVNGTHDCWVGGTGSAYNIRPLQVAYRGDGVNTKYCWSGAWTSTVHSDHSTQYGPKMAGGCWGHCGAGCPGSTTNEVNTVDCLNHDECTLMHGTAYGDCNNELSYASDDYTFAPSCRYTQAADAPYHPIGACP